MIRFVTRFTIEGMLTDAIGRSSGRTARSRAFSLVEVAVATALVAGMLVAAIDTVGAVARARRATADRTTGSLRAQQLAAEILSLPVLDPDDGAYTSGPGAGESDGTRSHFDNLGDYTGWRAVPQDKSGVKIAGMSGFLESVKISRPAAGRHGADLSSSAILLEVTVTVSGHGRTLGSITFVRGAASGAPIAGVPAS